MASAQARRPPGKPAPRALPDMVLAMVLAAAEAAEAEEARARLELRSANAAVLGRGESEAGREAGAGRGGGREGGRKGERQRDGDRASWSAWLAVAGACIRRRERSEGRGGWEGRDLPGMQGGALRLEPHPPTAYLLDPLLPNLALCRVGGGGGMVEMGVAGGDRSLFTGAKDVPSVCPGLC